MTAEPAAATRHTGTYPGRADQVRHVRRAVARHLAGCPSAADAVLIASELAANAILHSRSRTGLFTVRAELYPDHVRIEVEDLGGPWQPRPSGGRPHGLDIIAALTAPGDSGIDGDHAGRTAWARLTW